MALLSCFVVWYIGQLCLDCASLAPWNSFDINIGRATDINICISWKHFWLFVLKMSIVCLYCHLPGMLSASSISYLPGVMGELSCYCCLPGVVFTSSSCCLPGVIWAECFFYYSRLLIYLVIQCASWVISVTQPDTSHLFWPLWFFLSFRWDNVLGMCS